MSLTAKHIREVCRINQGEKTCCFLGGDRCDDGKLIFNCCKNTPLEGGIRAIRASGKMLAVGDNCDGRTGDVHQDEVFKGMSN